MINPKRLLFALLFLVSLPAFSQVSVQFVPEIFGRSMDGLMNASIFSVKDRRSVRLNITVSEAKAGKVLTIQTQPFTIIPGNNMLPPSAIRTSKVTISNTQTGSYVRQNSNFPTGDYEYSFVVISSISNEEVLVDQTFSQEIIPPAPLELIEPMEEDQICEKRPMFTWQPSFPQIAGALYQLTLVEMKEKQNAVEALNYNIPMINQKGIPINMLNFPPIAKELSSGKKYAWQVTVYKDQSIINRSEVWSFKVDCADTVVAKVEDDYGYRDIEDLAKGNFYVANGVVKFVVINSNAEQQFIYTINCVTDPSAKVKKLSKVILKNGSNKILLDFKNNFSFKDGYSYVLKATLPNGQQRNLKFIYRE